MLLVRGAEVMLISKLKGRVGIKQIDIQGWDFRQREQQRQIIKEQQSVQKAAGHGEYCVLHLFAYKTGEDILIHLCFLC